MISVLSQAMVGLVVSRACRWCSGPIGENKRRGTKFCSSQCLSASKSKNFRDRHKGYYKTGGGVDAYRLKEATKVKRRREVLSKYKEYVGCIYCGYNTNGLALQFDHREPSKKHRDVSSLVPGGLRKLFEEIRKCDVVCANCHLIKTFSGI